MLIGCLCVAEGYEYDTWLHPKVVQDLKDPALQDVMQRVNRSGSVLDIASLSIETLVRLWEMGYCEPPEEMPAPEPPHSPPPEEESQPEPPEDQDEDESDSEEGDESDDAHTGDSSGLGGSSEENPESAESDSSDGGDSSGDSSDVDLSGDGAGSPGDKSGDPEADGVSDGAGSGLGGESDGSSPDAPGDESGRPPEGAGDTAARGESGGNGECSSESGSQPDSTGSVSDGGEVEADGRDAESGPPTGDSSDGGGAVQDEQTEEGEGGTGPTSPTGGTSAGDQSTGEGDSGDGGGPDEDRSPGGSPDGSGDGSRESGELSSTEPGGTTEREPISESDPGGSDFGGPDDFAPDLPEEAGNDLSSGDPGADAGDEGDGDQARDVSSPGALDPSSKSGELHPGHDQAGTDGGEDLPDLGSADDVVELIQDFSGHNHDDDEELDFGPATPVLNEKAMDKAIVQNKNFDMPTATVSDVEVYTWPQDDMRCAAWLRYYESQNLTIRLNDSPQKWEILKTPEDILQPALFDMRRVFSENRRGKAEVNLRSGRRIHGKVLGRRAWSDDDRLFKKMTRPKSKSYAVVIGLDISGSTDGAELVVEKQAVFAQAELCSRMGVEFEVWAHSATGKRGDFVMQMYRIKAFNEPWSDKAKEGVSWLHSSDYNLDGHTAEFYRKRLMASAATTKILLYFTDGAMPAANKEDEVKVLQQEVRNYKQLGIIMLGVGIGTDSPKRWGMDTIRINNKGDIGKVVKHLESVLTANGR